MSSSAPLPGNQGTRKKSSPVQLGLTIVLGVLLAGLAAAGFLFGDDVEDFFDADSTLVERVQLQGYWLGMKLGNAEETARGLPGVTVLDISDTYGWRARQAGIMPGDVLLSVAGNKVSSLSELDTAVKKADATKGLPVELQRWGQPFSVVLPPLPQSAPPAAALPPLQPAVAPLPVTPAVAYGYPGVATPPAAPSPAGPMFYCPQHRMMWSQQHVHPHYRCPMCSSSLGRVQ
jgi:hypothetical protein